MKIESGKINDISIFFGLILILFIAGIGCINPCRSIFQRFEVTGVVTSETDSKLFLNSGSGQQKFVVEIDNKIYNCDSTACSSFKVGQKRTLSCYKEFHAFEPDEYECRAVMVGS